MQKNFKEKVKGKSGITLIILVISIIVLLILVRSNDCDPNGRKWDFIASS